MKGGGGLNCPPPTYLLRYCIRNSRNFQRKFMKHKSLMPWLGLFIEITIMVRRHEIYYGKFGREIEMVTAAPMAAQGTMMSWAAQGVKRHGGDDRAGAPNPPLQGQRDRWGPGTFPLVMTDEQQEFTIPRKFHHSTGIKIRKKHDRYTFRPTIIA